MFVQCTHDKYGIVGIVFSEAKLKLCIGGKVITSVTVFEIFVSGIFNMVSLSGSCPESSTGRNVRIHRKNI